MISPPKPLDQIQPNEVCELLTCMGRATAKVNFVCVLTNERYKTYQMGFSLSPWSFPRGGTMGCLGIKN